MISNKQRIIDATFSLALDYGFDNVSMKQIQKESGLAIGSIYYHFENKDEILEYIVNQYLIDGVTKFKKEVRAFEGPFKEKLKFIFFYNSNLFATRGSDSDIFSIPQPEFSHKDFWTLFKGIFHQHPEVRDKYYKFHDELYDFYYELIEEAIENKEVREDIDIRELIIILETSLKGYVTLWTYQPSFSFEEIVDTNIKWFWELIKR